MTRDRCDVLIVGGGPAGSSCAFGLRGLGLDVVVMDRAHFPRDKVCAGWVTPAVLDDLAIDPVEYAKERVMQPIRGFRVGRLGDAEVVADRSGIVSWAIRRCEFDAYLLARSGARVRAGEPVREVHRAGERYVVNDAVEASILVGAGGHFCPIARWCGARPGVGERAVVAREVEFHLDERQQALCPTLPEVPELLFSPDLEGYGWIVRKGEYLNVGLGRQVPDDFPDHVARFLARLRGLQRLPPGTPSRWAGHAYLLKDRSQRALSARGALLVGDAAGLAYPRSGEGIRPAVESGLLAARAIRSEPGSREGRARRYAQAVEARFGRRTGRPGPGPTDLLPAAWKGPVSARVLANRWFASHVVVDRWFLHRGVPPLAA